MHYSLAELENAACSLIERWLALVPTQGILQPQFEPFALATQRGLVRKENQDRVVVAKLPPDASRVPTYIGIVSDGMGGMESGDLASDLTVANILATLMVEPQPESEYALRRALHRANAIIFEKLKGRGGSAVCVFVRRGELLTIASAGDVRAYAIHHDRKLEQLTTDDTLAGQLAALGKTPQHDQNKLLQYIGMGHDLQPHVHRVAGNIRGILLTSDGVHSLPMPILQFIARYADTPKTFVTRLLEVSGWSGGSDNGSAIVLGLAPPPASHPPPEELSIPGVLDVWTPSQAFSISFERLGSVRQSITRPEPNGGDKTYQPRTTRRKRTTAVVARSATRTRAIVHKRPEARLVPRISKPRHRSLWSLFPNQRRLLQIQTCLENRRLCLVIPAVERRVRPNQRLWTRPLPQRGLRVSTKNKAECMGRDVMKNANRFYGGRYRALGQSFSGGGGLVEICEDTNLDRKVAIKFLHTQVERRRIFDEIKALQRIRSKNVVDVYDIVVENGGSSIGIVQEFLEGEDLTAQAQKPRDDKVFLKILYQMANGLADIHAQGIVHRDIKPNNMKFGAENLLKIFDFGLARDTSADAMTYGFKGTMCFAAPEQYGQGLIPFSEQVDVYSLAVSALYLRCGGASLPAALTAVPPDPGQWLKSGGSAKVVALPHEITELLDAAMSPLPEQRPRAAEIRDCLARMLLKDRHRALLVEVASGRTFELNAQRKTVQLASPEKNNVIDIRYTGMQFLASSVQGDVSINNRAVQAGTTIPGSCVIALGPSSLGARRIFVTVDQSHPEVVL